jgi:flagellar basal-body rod protein FlgB
MFVNDITTATLTAAMRGGMARQEALAQNVANSDTPNYQRMTVSFEGALADALSDDQAGLSAPGERAVDTVKPTFQVTTNTQTRVDGSNIDPDAEMSELSSNQLAYNTNTRLLAERFQQLAAAISGR